MLDSERRFTSRFAGKEIVQYLQNYKRHEVEQGHSRKLL